MGHYSQPSAVSVGGATPPHKKAQHAAPPCSAVEARFRRGLEHRRGPNQDELQAKPAASLGMEPPRSRWGTTPRRVQRYVRGQSGGGVR